MSTQQSQMNPGPCEGFDEFAGQRWIYPNNMPIRGYQKAAVEMALLKNAMIVLPTGFGKTFIAAVVMYNFYCWYPRGKIIFMAPTKPLVAQQINECKRISGIPSSACVELTGLIGSTRRESLLEEKRVIFATPQVIENDLRSGILPARMVRCIVIDEAHKATGNFAYVEIVRMLQDENRNGFRILALSATPGSDIEKVQQVMQKLYISDIMFRTEDSIDLMAYRNTKSSHAWTVELKGLHLDLVNRYIKIADPVFKDLHRAGVTYNADSIRNANKYCLVKILNNNHDQGIVRSGTTPGKLKHLAGLGMSLLHNFELLTLYGLRVFYVNITAVLKETRNNLRTFLASKIEFDMILTDIKRIFGDDVIPNPDKMPDKDLTLGHPKFEVVKDQLIKHFSNNQDKQETRAIVFTKYRDSVYDIVQTLRKFEPLVKPTAFIGQNKTSKTEVGGGMTQREQAQVIKDFKEGKFNVIVATCVAEEGLDIGEVDLIIAYDTSSSTSTTQRRGRTGRKRSGVVHSVLTKGYEEKKARQAGDMRRTVEGQLYNRENYNAYKYRDAPRMVPLNITPLCLEMNVFPVDDVDETDSARKVKRKRASKSNGSTSITKKSKADTSMECIKKSCKASDSSQEIGFKSASELLSSDWPDDMSSDDGLADLSSQPKRDSVTFPESSPDTLWT